MFLGTFLSDKLKQDKIIINSELKVRSEILINFPFFGLIYSFFTLYHCIFFFLDHFRIVFLFLLTNEDK